MTIDNSAVLDVTAIVMRRYAQHCPAGTNIAEATKLVGMAFRDIANPKPVAVMQPKPKRKYKTRAKKVAMSPVLADVTTSKLLAVPIVKSEDSRHVTVGGSFDYGTTVHIAATNIPIATPINPQIVNNDAGGGWKPSVGSLASIKQ